MLLLGILAFIQITFLPGVLILKAFDIRKGLLDTCIFAFGLSLVANHLIVFITTSLKLPITYVYYTLFIIEILILIRFYQKIWSTSLGDQFKKWRKSGIEYFSSFNLFGEKSESTQISKILKEIINFVFIILAFTSLWWAIKVWYTNIDTIFTQWDAIQSWNSWATQWFSGTFPQQTWRYPQLIPTNFAVSYAFLGGTQIQIFAKSFMPLFNVFILVMLLDLGLETKNSGYFIGMVAARFIIKKFLGELISSGYVDVALAFFAFLPIYVLLKAQNEHDQKRQIHYLWLGGILSAGTALTKQNGLLIFAVYPVLAYFLVVRNFENQNIRSQLSLLAKIGLVSLLIFLPWYLFNEYQIQTGMNESNVSYLIGDRHEGRDLLQRFSRAWGLLEEYAFLYPFVIIMLSFLGSGLQWIALTILIPYSLIWAFAFSTFPRNLALALPFLGLLVGFSAQKLIDMCADLISKIKLERLKTYSLIIGLCVIILGSLFVPNKILIDHQTEQQKNILIAGVNKRLYDYFEEMGKIEPIMTNYPVQYLPGLEDLQIDIGNFNDFEQYIWTINNNPNARLLLIFEGRANKAVLEDVEAKIVSGEYERIFKEGKYTLIRIKR